MRTLAFPFSIDMAKPVWCYRFSPDLNATWQDLTRRYTRVPQQLPYRDLTDAVRFVTRDYATIRKEPRAGDTLLLSRTEIPSETRGLLFATFEQQLAARNNKPFEDQLRPLVEQINPRKIKIERYLAPTGTPRPETPTWVYDVATWSAIGLLKGDFRLPNGKTIHLRPDTDGNLVAFDHPLPEHHPRGEQGIHYISLAPLTLPGYSHILLSLDAHISATTGWGGNARSLWIAPDDKGVLLCAKRGWDHNRQINVISGQLPALVDSFSIQRVPTAFLDSDLIYGNIRARHASPPNHHPIASGPGRKFLEALHQHACERLKTTPIALEDSRVRNINAQPADSAAAAKVLTTSIIKAVRRSHLSVIYANDSERARAARAIAEVLGLESSVLKTRSAELLDGALTINFLPVDKPQQLLDPGPPENRHELVDDACSGAPAERQHIALIETSKERGTKADDSADPKHQIRAILASRGVVSQFIDQSTAPKPGEKDHPALAAVRDVFRAAGLTASSPRNVFAKPFTQHTACVLVGLFTRERTMPAQRMVSLVALATDGTNAPWRMFGYHPAAGGWAPLPEAIAAHHASPLTPFVDRDSAVRLAQAREYGERALQHLRILHPDVPMVVYVDSSERFPVWSGLNNNSLDLAVRGPLPHQAMANNHQVALVRVNTSSGGKLFQPVGLSRVSRQDPNLVSSSELLYQLPGGSPDAFYLINRSRSDKAKDFGVRPGHRMTRFETTEDERALRTPWHAMTCTEFLLLDHGSLTRLELATLSARLCGHPLVWDSRTTLPAPLHHAEQVLADHPNRNIMVRTRRPN